MAIFTPIAIICVRVAGRDWTLWIAIAAAAFVAVRLFVFVDEVNENVRYVRQQLVAQRDAVAALRREFARYRQPERVTPMDVVTALDSHWENPREFDEAQRPLRSDADGTDRTAALPSREDSAQ